MAGRKNDEPQATIWLMPSITTGPVRARVSPGARPEGSLTIACSWCRIGAQRQ
ncbi:MAG: hypothetical protein IPM01_14520 [Burkholderiaceae bacterium]|nr:hypothetical protein [Burkholderiaceae bacterium]